MLVNEGSLVRLEKKKYDQYRIEYERFLHEDHLKLLLEYYHNRMGEKLHIDTPISYNEKLQWLKLNWRNDLANKCTDKYIVRNILNEMGYDELMVPMIAVYDDAQDINFSDLPNSFVLKPTNSSGFNLFVKNKDKIDPKRVKSVFQKVLNLHYYASKLEWCYEGIKPRIICEELMEIPQNKPLDYKFYCFHGEVKFVEILTASEWYENKDMDELIVDRNFIKQEFSYSFRNQLSMDKSVDFEKMVEYAERLSSPFPHVRVDLYNPSDGVIKFGEFTFFPSAGYGVFTPKETDITVGKYLDLNKLQH